MKAVWLLAVALTAEPKQLVVSWQSSGADSYVVYRAPGRCSEAQPATRIGTAGASAVSIATLPPLPGRYCYSVAAVLAGDESERSEGVDYQSRPAPPTGVAVTLTSAAVP